MNSRSQDDELEEAIRGVFRSIDLVRNRFFSTHVRIKLSEISLTLFLENAKRKLGDISTSGTPHQTASAAFDIVHHSLANGLISYPIFGAVSHFMDEAQARDYATALLASAAIRRQLLWWSSQAHLDCYVREFCRGKCLLERFDNNGERAGTFEMVVKKVLDGQSIDNIHRILDDLSTATCDWFRRSRMN